MVGPDFHAPRSPHVKRYNIKPLPKHTALAPLGGKAGRSQQFVRVCSIPEEWWRLFHSKPLNRLIQKGLAHSPTLGAAEAALRQAEETLRAQIGNSLYPAFSTQLSGQRQRFGANTIGESDASISPVFNIFNASVNVSYMLDVFGGARRQIESLLAQVDYQQYQFLGAYLTLTSNIVTTSVTVASLEAQIRATKALIRAQEDQLQILRKQLRLGGVSGLEVSNQATLVNQSRAALPTLEKNLSLNRHALSVLVGDFPNKKPATLPLDALTLPKHLPISLPSILVKQRPDIKAQEALLHAASAQIGVATANLLPKFTLTASYGWSANVLSSLFDPINKVWNYGLSITQPIFQGGALWAQRRAAIAAFDQACYQYKQTVLQAFQNVADTLRALETDARSYRFQVKAELAALKALRITEQQYRDGGVDYLNLLNAQQQYQQVKIAKIQAQALRYNDTAALFQALGGGWWNNCKLSCEGTVKR